MTTLEKVLTEYGLSDAFACPTHHSASQKEEFKCSNQQTSFFRPAEPLSEITKDETLLASIGNLKRLLMPTLYF